MKRLFFGVCLFIVSNSYGVSLSSPASSPLMLQTTTQNFSGGDLFYNGASFIGTIFTSTVTLKDASHAWKITLYSAAADTNGSADHGELDLRVDGTTIIPGGALWADIQAFTGTGVDCHPFTATFIYQPNDTLAHNFRVFAADAGGSGFYLVDGGSNCSGFGQYTLEEIVK